MIMPYGKYRGKLIENVPHDYLLCVLDNCDPGPTLKDAINRVLKVGNHITIATDPTLVAMEGWYRTLAREFHPDAGGSHAAMVAVNRARDLMLGIVLGIATK